MDLLPIDEHLPSIVAAVRGGKDVVLAAPPGSGKTTRVPAALVDAGLPGGGRVLVLQPRRMAARLAARRVASERGEKLGDRVGYRVRFEAVAGRETRLLFVTEGLLTRRLLGDAELAGVSVVVFDEFHERSLQADLALGMVREVQASLREDLRVVVMSATLDAETIASELDAVSLRAEGRLHPVEIEFATRRDDARIQVQVARSLARVIDRDGGRLTGDILVFLPGVGEILRTAREVETMARTVGFDVRPLYGELPVEQQDLAVRRGRRPRVVLSTNVAETSVTLDGISTVIDTGLARVPRHDPRSGIDRLVLERINQASAEQRAGRAGRQGPGRCVRFYTRGEFREMARELEPEVMRVDLCEALLTLRSWGCADPLQFAWMTAPPPAKVESASRLLEMLGAVESKVGRITELGKRLADLPVHPRIGRMLLVAARSGCARDGALLAALCQAGRIQRGGRPGAERSDLLRLRDLFLRSRDARFDRSVVERLGLSQRVVRAVDREARQLEGLSSTRASQSVNEDALLRCVLSGFPDRVARRRAPDVPEALMVGGFAVRLDECSVVRDAELFVALDATGVGSGVRVRVASAIDPGWLEELFPAALRTEAQTVWNERRERAEARQRRYYHDLLLEDAPGSDIDPDEATALLTRAATHPRFLASLQSRGLERLLARVECLRGVCPELDLPEPGEEWLAEAVRSLCHGRTSLAEIRDAPIGDLLMAVLGTAGAGRLRHLVPDRIRLPSGRDAPVTYRREQTPLVSAKLQEFFGSAASPRIADGRLVVALDLLAPNGRSVQITTDLASFWKELYPRIRRELSRRYPRHPWPEDPQAATPTSRPLPRKRKPGH